jgi:hypothetical protein
MEGQAAGADRRAAGLKIGGGDMGGHSAASGKG